MLPPLTSYLSCGHLFYRTLHLDESRNALYVGGMDRLIKVNLFSSSYFLSILEKLQLISMQVNLANVSATDCASDSLLLEPSNVANCVSKGKSEKFDCRNHVRVIQPIGDGERLYVCGTNAHNPRDQVVYANLTSLGRHEYVPGIGNGIAKCPFDPEDNSTTV